MQVLGRWLGWAIALCLTVGCGLGKKLVSPHSRGGPYTEIYALTIDTAQDIDYQLTTDAGQRAQLIAQSWQDAQGSFRLLTSSGPGRIQLFECADLGGRHFFSADPNCENQQSSGSSLGYLNNVNDDLTPYALHRCYESAGQRTYHFPAVGENCPPGVQDEGVLGYVQNPDPSLIGAIPTIPPPPFNQVLVYRFSNPVNGDYLYSLDKRAVGGFQYDGTAFTIVDSQLDPSMVPLYSCVAPDGSHFTSNYARCEGGTSTAQLGWVFTSRGIYHSDSSALFRFHNPSNPSSHMTMSLKQGVQAGWIFEASQGYQYDAGMTTLAPPQVSAYVYAAGQEVIGVDAQTNYHTYAYGPSIMLVPGQGYYLWACSGPDGTGDSIVLTQSGDGAHWSSQTYALHAFTSLNPQKDGLYSNACDPSVVSFTPLAGGPSYFYLYFGMTSYTLNTVIGVARSTNPQGPFAVYTGGDPNDSNNWTTQVSSSQLPKILIKSAVSCNSNPGCYGAGQPSVVAKNGKLYMWYTDMTASPWGIYYTQSDDGVNWTPAQSTGLATSSVDVKYDERMGYFTMAAMDDVKLDGTQMVMNIFTSQDGVHWQKQNVAGNQLPPYSNNIGMAGDPLGHMLHDRTFIGFGAPYQLNDPTYTNACNSSNSPDHCAPFWNVWLTPFYVERD